MPIDSRARVPVRIIRSAQEILRPYFCLIGQSNLRALSRLTLSGQLLSGAKRWVPDSAPPRPSWVRAGRLGAGPGPAATVMDSVGARAVPGHPDEERTVVAVVGGPPVLRGRHQRHDVLLKGLKVETLELLGVVERRVHRVRARRVAIERPQLQLVGPPVLMGSSPHRRGVKAVRDRALV